jgi:N-succinyl-L-ornithine transcarbamylase
MMKHFLSADDAADIDGLVRLAAAYKSNPLSDKTLGEDKTLGLIFMNPSLRTRLSTQKAALNLGMHVMVMNFTGEGWALETEKGVIMDGDKAEHIQEAAAVIGQYCDVIGLRSFPGLKNRAVDYAEETLDFFVSYAGVPVINLESATLHPLQSLADVLTIEQYKTSGRPKVLLTWAPHPRALPQSVANSFAQWIGRTESELVIANPEGYDLAPEFTGNARIVHSAEEAYAGADFVYAKNWSSYEHYGQVLNTDRSWMVDERKMALTNNAKFMHCLPVRRNMVVSDGVIEGSNSVVVEEAGNRTYAAQAVLATILKTLP